MRSLGELQGGVHGMRTCRQVGRILQTYLDGELDTSRVEEVAAHLEQCRRCGMKADTYERIKDSLARAGQQGWVHPEDQLSLERLRRFADSLGS